MNALLSALEQRAQKSPNDVVLTTGEGGLPAVEILAMLQELALVFRATEARTIALLANNSPWWAVVDLACQLDDLCVVPVPTFFTAAQIEHLLHSAGADLLVFDESQADKLDSECFLSSQMLPGVPGFGMVSLQPDLQALTPHNTSKVTFTSGSTGEPKGVCLSFEQCLEVARSLAGAIGISSPRHLCLLPLSTLLENICGVYMPILAGGCCVIPPPDKLGLHGSSGLDGPELVAAIDRAKPNTLILVPQMLVELDAALEQGWQPPESLRFAAVGGARVAPALIDRVRQCGLPVYEGYGLSECASVVSLNTPYADRPGTSGRTLPHVEVKAVEGELEVSGNVFLGYLNEPTSWGMNTVFTGDIGTVDSDGYLSIGGRSKNIIITGFGRNVSPEWVESELLACSSFRQSIVLGDGRPSCAALLLPTSPETTDADIQATIDRVNAALPDYARIEHWLRLSEPLTAANGLLTENGRPKRQAIEAHYQKSIDQLYSESRGIMAL